MLKTYETCPKKYYLKYIEKLNVPTPATPFEKGKKIHALANYYLQGVNISRIETALTEDEKNTWTQLLNNPFYKKDSLKSEFSLLTKIDKYWIGGRVDAIVHDYDKYYILDYKTGSTPKNAEYDYQTMTYLLCVSNCLKNYASLSFVYINLREKQNYVIEFNKKLKTEYEQRLTNICEKITNDTQYEQNHKNCKNCEYHKFCK